MSKPDVIAALSVKAAAQRLGRSEMRLHGMIREGKLPPVATSPIKLSAADVEDLRQAQHAQAVEEFAARGVDLVRLAADVRRQVRPLVTDPLPGGTAAVTRLPSKVRDVFGPAALAALTLGDQSQCCWCAARVAAGLYRVPAPR